MWRLGLVLFFTVWLLGCPSVIHIPSTTLVASDGIDFTRQRLRDVMLLAVAPSIQDVEITDEYYEYFLNATTVSLRVFFKNASRVDVYSNRVLIVWGHGNQILSRLYFSSEDEAKLCADLIWSLREHALAVAVR